MILAIYFIVCLIEPRFFSSGAVINILLFVPFLLILALGEMIEIISGNVDVSLGSILAVSAFVTGLVFLQNEQTPLPLAFLIGTGCGLGLGLFNGFLVTKFKIPSVIVTLGTMNIYRGMIFILGGKQIDNRYIPDSLIDLSQPSESVIGIPYSVIIAAVIAIIIAIFLQRSRLGRQIYEVGGNPVAAKLKGIE